jgi:aspartyl-tRNA(Asn)/glutamyl-tRNA(Gln) amidotransferase subunit A
MAMGSSLDQIGPLGRTVGDVEAVFSAIKGLDPLDSTSIDFASDTKKKDRLIVGVPRHLMEDGVEDDVLEAFNGALEKLATAGHTIKDIELKNVSYALGVYYIIMPAEASTNLARFDGMRFGLLKEGDTLLEDYAITRGEGFGKEVRRRIMLGTYVLSAGYYDAYYNKAQTVRELIHNDFEEAFKTVDVIATPTAPTPAFGIGEKSDPLSMYLSDIFTIPANLTGMPAISVPAGTVSRKEKDLPIGLQFAAPHKQENLLFSVGKSFLNE